MDPQAADDLESELGLPEIINIPTQIGDNQLSHSQAAISQKEYAAIAAFRYHLRRFLAFSEAAAGEAGLPPQQHQALLSIAGHAEPLSVGGLAEQLLIAPHTAAELATRMNEAGLITKTASAQDRRRIELRITPQAEGILRRLTAAHLEELRTLEPALVRALGRLRRESV